MKTLIALSFLTFASTTFADCYSDVSRWQDEQQIKLRSFQDTQPRLNAPFTKEELASYDAKKAAFRAQSDAMMNEFKAQSKAKLEQCKSKR